MTGGNMGNNTYRFRSIMVNNVEKVVPGTVFSKMVLEMDDSNNRRNIPLNFP